jgi:XRE family transcriptional regulator, regulator of sulfur utilization
MKQPGDTVAQNLQNLRETRNLSLDKLAEMTGVSKSMLRQIEIGQSNPTIATIWKIANGLRIPFTALLKQQTQAVALGAFKERAPIPSEVDGYRIHPLISFNPERAFETYYLEIEPGVLFEAEPHQGHAEEHVFVMQGQITVSVAGEAFLVGKEHFISFQADCVHGYQNFGTDMAVAIMTISYMP